MYKVICLRPDGTIKTEFFPKEKDAIECAKFIQDFYGYPCKAVRVKLDESEKE